MQSSLYIGATGLKTHSSGMHTVSNNLANVSTVGYKQQSLLFEDLMYQAEPCMGSAWPQVFNQRGMGAETGAVRTLFTEGAFEPGSTVTDLALGGKGFFEVTKDDKTHYTRAGNFRFDKEGYLKDPNGYTLSGIPLADGQPAGGVGPIKLLLGSTGIMQSPPKATTEVTSVVNLGFQTDSSADPANPCFGLLSAWNGTKEPPLDTNTYGYAQPMRVYDSAGNPHTATMYFDSTGLGSSGETIYEYVVGIPPGMDGSAAKNTTGAGLLMSGTLKFSPSGELIDMSAFSPAGGDYKNLANWTPSALVGGKPQVNMTLASGEAVNFTVNLGISGTGGWSNAPATAAAVGTTAGNLPSLGSVTRDSVSSTARGTASNLARFDQNGYSVGSMSALDITNDGKVVASYTNGQSTALYDIPVFRFTSEDGLYHEGMNHYSYTPDAGKKEHGTAGTENYGKIESNTLEMSNVDMAREITMMIIMQRGFQMNSKTITTSDAMLQKALELKR